MGVEKVITDLLIENPYYGYLAGKLRYRRNEQVKHVKVIWEAHPVLLYNGEWFDGLPKALQTGYIVHELLHLALLHFYRRDGRQAMLWYVACDIAVSELMEGYVMPSDIVTRPVAARELGMVLKKHQTAEYYYDAMSEAEDIISFKSKGGEALIVFEGGESYPVDMLDELVNDNLESQAMIEELTKVSMTALDEQSVSTELLEQIEDAYSSYRIQWRSVLRRFLEGHGKIRTRKSYKRQSRRFVDLPGSKRAVGLQALLAIDESASISDRQVEVFHRELMRINQITGDDIQVVRFDTACSEPVPLATFVTAEKRTMRGGTDFRPVFQLADKMRVKNIILFTDGDGQAPPSAPQRVLWVLTNNGKCPVDYGVSVKFEEG